MRVEKARLKYMLDMSVVATAILLVVLYTSSLASTIGFRNYIEKKGVNTINEHMDMLILQLKEMVESDSKELKTVSRILGLYEDLESEEAKAVLSSFDREGMLSDMYLLLPDDRILLPDGSTMENNTELDFGREELKHEYISPRMDCFADIEEKLVLHTVPVKRDGEIRGILCGVVRLQRALNLYNVTFFNGAGEIYLTEGSTGKFLLDTWHGVPTSLAEIGPRETKKGYDYDAEMEAMLRGESGMVLLLSRRLDEYIYLGYKSVGINDWRIALHVPESSVFWGYKEMNRYQHVLWIIRGSAIMLYVIWILHYKSRKALEKEMLLGQVNYMFDIQKTLFDAHQTQGRMEEALEKVGEKMHAQSVFLLIMEEQAEKAVHMWNARGKDISDSIQIFKEIQQNQEHSGSYVIWTIEELKGSMPAIYQKLKQQGIHNLMLGAGKSSEKDATGILGAWNIGRQYKDCSYLESVMMHFIQAHKNIAAQNTIGELATVDMLTGLLNRNSYEKELGRRAREKKIPDACIYIDVNGLHELNNSLGHAAGDEMLRFIADALVREFGREYTYRIGGDEYVVFVSGTPREVVEERIALLIERVEAQDYYISVGVEYGTGYSRTEDVLASAEKKMYAQKEIYYRTRKNEASTRRRNLKLEKMLQEKSDMEQLIQLIAPAFTGIYIAELKNDTSRAIYVPDYLRDFTKQYESQYTGLLEAYIEQFVLPEDRQELREKLTYERLTQLLDEHKVVDITYRRLDGRIVALHICRTAKYGDTEKETLWMFIKDGTAEKQA